MAKRWLNEGLVIKSEVRRIEYDEPVDSIIARTVKEFERLGIEATVGVLGDAPDISSTVEVKVVPWKQLTDIGNTVEKRERERIRRFRSRER